METTWPFVINIVAALLMGIAIGLERQLGHHTAGLRTNALVCIGAALFVSLSRLLDKDGEGTRIAAQVVSGIGFLCGGVILREGFNVRGMNTAATLWCSAAIGCLTGSGFIAHGAIGTAAVILLHLGLRPIARKIEVQNKLQTSAETIYRMSVSCKGNEEGVVRTIFLRHVNSQANMTIQGLSTQQGTTEEEKVVVAEIYCTERNDRYMNELVSRMSIEPNVTSVSWVHHDVTAGS